MSELSQDQLEMREKISKSAMVWGSIVGVLIGLLALWLLSGQSSAIRFGGAAAVALVVGGLVRRASFKSGSKSAQCGNCGTAFSRSMSDRKETLASSESKEERVEQPDRSTKLTTWVEETYDVVDTYTCAKCNDATTKSYKTTRRRNEETKILPAPKDDSSKKGAAAAVVSENSIQTPDETTTGKTRSGKSSSEKSSGGKSSASKSSSAKSTSSKSGAKSSGSKSKSGGGTKKG